MPLWGTLTFTGASESTTQGRVVWSFTLETLPTASFVANKIEFPIQPAARGVVGNRITFNGQTVAPSYSSEGGLSFKLTGFTPLPPSAGSVDFSFEVPDWMELSDFFMARPGVGYLWSPLDKPNRSCPLSGIVAN